MTYKLDLIVEETDGEVNVDFKEDEDLNVDFKEDLITLKGPKGDKGDPGPAGPQGPQGDDGNDGYTPIKGQDYFTEDEKQQIIDDAVEVFKSTTRIVKIGEITMLAESWVGENNLYSQVVSVDGVTEYSQVDITPNVNQLAIFYEKDLTFVTENEDGVVTVYAIGQKPTNDYTVQVTITEVSV